MFVGDAVRLGTGLAVARLGLARLADSSLLFSVCEAAYDQGMSALAAGEGGPADAGPGMCRLAAVHARDRTGHGDSAGLILRWQAIGPDGELFPALDADLTLSPDEDQGVVLTLAGAYRPPPGSGGGPDRAAWQGAADAAIGAFLGRFPAAMGALAAGPNGGTAR